MPHLIRLGLTRYDKTLALYCHRRKSWRYADDLRNRGIDLGSRGFCEAGWTDEQEIIVSQVPEIAVSA